MGGSTLGRVPLIGTPMVCDLREYKRGHNPKAS